MTIRIVWVVSGRERTYRDMTQREVNSLITHLSNLQDQWGAVGVRVEVGA